MCHRLIDWGHVPSRCWIKTDSSTQSSLFLRWHNSTCWTLQCFTLTDTTGWHSCAASKHWRPPTCLFWALGLPLTSHLPCTLKFTGRSYLHHLLWNSKSKRMNTDWWWDTQAQHDSCKRHSCTCARTHTHTPCNKVKPAVQLVITFKGLLHTTRTATEPCLTLRSHSASHWIQSPVVGSFTNPPRSVWLSLEQQCEVDWRSNDLPKFAEPDAVRC